MIKGYQNYFLMKRTKLIIHYSLLTGFLVLFGLSCTKRPVSGTFFVKGRFLESSGEPKKNMEVYVQYTVNAGYVGSYTRERVGSGVTDSLGYFGFECNYHGDVEYKIRPLNDLLTPGKGDTIDYGTHRW